MTHLEIVGGAPLSGKVSISGAKNAALPCLFATLLTDGEVSLTNIPDVTDVRTATSVLEHLGKKVVRDDGGIRVSHAGENRSTVPAELGEAMRASILSLGPLLATAGKAVVPLPGGCDFGERPVDMHVAGLEKMGARIQVRDGALHAHADRFRGANVELGYPTFTGTENLMMAAVLAKGRTVINNAAREPEVSDLARLLISMGARITGHGTGTILVEGVPSLGPATHCVITDRIEAGTYLAAAVATRGDVEIDNVEPAHLEALLERLSRTGARLDIGDGSIKVAMPGRPKAVDVETAPHPGFPTDLQAQTLALNSVADGSAAVVETVWKNRFRTAFELIKLGADIRVDGNRALVAGKDSLVGAELVASDLRASASLVIAAMCASGLSVVRGLHHLERGYDNLPGKLAGLGAQVRVARSAACQKAA